MKRYDQSFRDKWLESLTDEERQAIDAMSSEEETDLYAFFLEDLLKDNGVNP